jgi:hypothetical protein
MGIKELFDMKELDTEAKSIESKFSGADFELSKLDEVSENMIKTIGESYMYRIQPFDTFENDLKANAKSLQTKSAQILSEKILNGTANTLFLALKFYSKNKAKKADMGTNTIIPDPMDEELETLKAHKTL